MTATPDGDAVDLAGLARQHLTPVLGRYFERSWSHGEGHRLFDTAGKSYLDFANGIAVSALGHHHPAVTAAIHEQVDRLIVPTGAIGYSEPTARLAVELADTFPEPLDTVMFLNSGSEAIEAALKLARRVTGRPGIVAFQGGFHGRTLGAASVTTSNIEPVQGEGGYTPAPTAFLQVLRAICHEHGILLIADEVQTGFGRTGRMWAFEHAGIVPDVVCVAKAIANGLPLSAIVSSHELQARWGRGAHGSTFGGNPVACAAGLAVLRTIREQRLLVNAAARGAELTAGLRRIMAEDDRIGDVRGPGLMVGAELVLDRATREPDGATCEALLARAADEGLLVLSCGSVHQVVRWVPPLDVTAAEILEGLEVFANALGGLPHHGEGIGS